jgi:vancomycin resistance protein YoaR
MPKISSRLVYSAVPFLVIGIIYASFEVAYLDRVYPKISIAGIDVGNKNTKQVHAILTNDLTAHSTIVLSWGTSRWEIALNDLDVEYDPKQTAEQAYKIGRSGKLIPDTKTKIIAWKNGMSVPAVFVFDENKLAEAISQIALQIDIPAQEPEIRIVDQKIEVSAGANGQAVDERRLTDLIKRSIANDESTVEIPVNKLEPQITENEVEQVRARGESLLNKTLTLKLNEQIWDILPEQTISWIDPSSQSGWKEEEIRKWVEDLAVVVDRPAENAYFQYIDSRVEEFRPAKEGLAVQKDKVGHDIKQKLDEMVASASSLSMDLSVTKTTPDITTNEVNNLGITELIGRGESNFAGSIPNRIFNLKLASEKMNGILVAPGETFSFNKYVGDISAAGGYKQAYIIQNGRTILGDGGGVCQVSTTMFRAVLAAGLPVEERSQHAYRVSYYENDRQPGFDAAIFTPTQDFKFTNDTPAHILIQTKYDEAKKSLAFELFGTKDGRQVEISKARVWDVTSPPPPLYQDDPTLPVGTEKQVDWSAWGAKAAFDYKVTRNGEILQERTFYSNYRPWQAVYLRGTKV